MCKKNIYRFVKLSNLKKTSNRAVNHTSARKLILSTIRVICTCDQCDSAFCTLQLTALIKPNCCISVISLALKHLYKQDWKSVFIKLLHRPDDFIDFTLNCPPHFTTKLRPWI